MSVPFGEIDYKALQGESGYLVIDHGQRTVQRLPDYPGFKWTKIKPLHETDRAYYSGAELVFGSVAGSLQITVTGLPIRFKYFGPRFWKMAGDENYEVLRPAVPADAEHYYLNKTHRNWFWQKERLWLLGWMRQKVTEVESVKLIGYTYVEVKRKA